MSEKLKFFTASVMAAVTPSMASASDVPAGSKKPEAPVKKVGSQNPLEVSVTGAFVFSDFPKSIGVDGNYETTDGKLGLSPDIAKGGYGSISIGRKMDDPNYDWKVSAAVTEFMNGRSSYQIGSYTYGGGGYEIFSFADAKSGFQTLDFDLGKRISDNQMSGRVFAGMRAMHMSDDSFTGISKLGTGGAVGEYVDYGLITEHSFAGVGPRIGAEIQTSGTIALRASVSAALLYGKADRSYGFGYSAGYGQYNFSGRYTTNESSYDWVTDVEGSLGAVISSNDTMTLEAGYRGEYLKDINSAQQSDMLVHGPYLKVDMKF